LKLKGYVFPFIFPEKKASVHDSYIADIASKPSAKRGSDIEENRAARRQRYQKVIPFTSSFMLALCMHSW
jgi:hypothetical protein